MTTTAAIGGGASTLLIVIAAADFLYGSGKLGAFILTGMIIGAVVTAIAGRMAAGIAEAIPAASAFTGTIAIVIYWLIRIKMWIDQLAP